MLEEVNEREPAFLIIRCFYRLWFFLLVTAKFGCVLSRGWQTQPVLFLFKEVTWHSWSFGIIQIGEMEAEFIVYAVLAGLWKSVTKVF